MEMEPISLVASIAGILTAAGHVTTMVHDFVSRQRGAPTAAQRILTEVQDLRLCLGQLWPFLQEAQGTSRSRRAAISVETVVVISTSCVVTLSELERLLDSFHLDQPMSQSLRLRWARAERSIESLLSRLRQSSSSLNLMLVILAW